MSQASLQPAQSSNFFASRGFKRFTCVTGILISIAVTVASIFSVIGSSISFSSIISCTYRILFSILLVLGEIGNNWVLRWFLFLSSYLGFGKYKICVRYVHIFIYLIICIIVGVYYFFVGLYIVGEKNSWYQILVAVLACTQGVLYIILYIFGHKRGM